MYLRCIYYGNEIWVPKPFDLNLINNFVKNHPFLEIMWITYKYYPNYQEGGHDENGIDYYGGLESLDVVEDVNYSKMIDNFYRYGLTFQDKYDILPGNILHLYPYYDEDKPYHYNLIKIKLNECDTGEITLSEIENWKRKVINEQQNKKNQNKTVRSIHLSKFYNFLYFFEL